MDIKNHIKDNLIKIRVIPNSNKNNLILENNQLKLYIKAIPDKNKANLEIIKFFKKQFNLRVLIKSGLKSRDKVLKIVN
jgi:uncharacterized protein (TIGR00251 family)